jgi:hypothetical protein
MGTTSLHGIDLVSGATQGVKIFEERLGTAIPGGDTTADVTVVEGRWQTETVAASQTDQVLGTTGASGDVLHGVVYVPTNATNSLVIKDGATTKLTLTNLAVGLYPLELDWESGEGAWKITTGTNSAATCSGRFT